MLLAGVHWSERLVPERFGEDTNVEVCCSKRNDSTRGRSRTFRQREDQRRDAASYAVAVLALFSPKTLRKHAALGDAWGQGDPCSEE
jgi:hypothetical protein